MMRTCFLILCFYFFAANLFCQNSFEEAIRYFEEKDFGKAEVLFRNLLEDEPDNPVFLEYLGDLAAHSQNWDRAIFYYRQLAQNFEGNARYHYKYGGALGMKASGNKLWAVSQIRTIRHQLELAADLDPNHIEVRWALIEYYLQLPGILGGSKQKAIFYADQLRSVSKVDHFLARGRIGVFYSDFQEAEKNYKQAAETGKSMHTFEKLAGLYEDFEMPEKAIQTYKEAMQYHRVNALNFEIGRISAGFNFRSQTGIHYLNRYLTNHSAADEENQDAAYFYLAKLYYNQNQIEKALAAVEKSLSKNSSLKPAKELKKNLMRIQ